MLCVWSTKNRWRELTEVTNGKVKKSKFCHTAVTEQASSSRKWGGHVQMLGWHLHCSKSTKRQFSCLSCFNGHSPHEGTKVWRCFLTWRIAQVMSTKIFHQGFCWSFPALLHQHPSGKEHMIEGTVSGKGFTEGRSVKMRLCQTDSFQVKKAQLG